MPILTDRPPLLLRRLDQELQLFMVPSYLPYTGQGGYMDSVSIRGTIRMFLVASRRDDFRSLLASAAMWIRSAGLSALYGAIWITHSRVYKLVLPGFRGPRASGMGMLKA